MERQPIVADSAGVIVVGHARHKAAIKLGLKTVPVHVAADLTPAQARAYRLAEERTANGHRRRRGIAQRPALPALVRYLLPRPGGSYGPT